MTRNKMQMHDNNAAKPYRTPLIASAMSFWNMTNLASEGGDAATVVAVQKTGRRRRVRQRQATRPYSICHGFGKFGLT